MSCSLESADRLVEEFNELARELKTHRSVIESMPPEIDVSDYHEKAVEIEIQMREFRRNILSTLPQVTESDLEEI